ncbi:hypothetical protein HK100_010288 [Physocladia obscura]|uniref:Uncharacterized protein n=1 Tax=Physocladia obscura TaxID=109957 RepID=A0AAD5SMZ0_9FUNG|nr:hypothetical protein HK100_010288 [Physocladia obscura]
MDDKTIRKAPSSTFIIPPMGFLRKSDPLSPGLQSPILYNDESSSNDSLTSGGGRGVTMVTKSASVGGGGSSPMVGSMQEGKGSNNIGGVARRAATTMQSKLQRIFTQTNKSSDK